MNIRRTTKYRALVLAAEAGALNMTAKTPEDDARVVELLKQAENILEQRPTANLVFEAMLEGEHPSDNMSHKELFPNMMFSCYDGAVSLANQGPEVWGHGWVGNDIIARGLARYRDAIEDMEFTEARKLLARLIRFFQDHHESVGISDTEPRVAIQIAVNEFIFAGKTGFDKCDRGDWSKYLEIEPQFDYQTTEV